MLLADAGSDIVSSDGTVTSQDCAGVWGGSSVEDECGICDGSGPEENFDCDGNCLVEVDCAGVCGGDAVADECGECGGEGLPECGGNDVITLTTGTGSGELLSMELEVGDTYSGDDGMQRDI